MKDDGQEPWWTRQACQDVDPKVFDGRPAPDRYGVDWSEARHLCVNCPVRQECLTEVLRYPHQEGMDRAFVAGYTPSEIRKFRKQIRRGHGKRYRSGV